MAARIEINDQRGGLNVHLPAGISARTPAWWLGGFSICFVRLQSAEVLQLDLNTTTFVKVITGELAKPRLTPFPSTGQVRSTEPDETRIVAADDSIVCIIQESKDVSDRITDMSELRVSGPHSDLLAWQTFDEKFHAVTDAIKGLEAHMVPGFHLLDAYDQEIAYVHFWTTGKGQDVSTHNHGQEPSALSPAFAEIHLVLRNGTGAGAMYKCASREATERQRTVIDRGEEHGPFFGFDKKTGKPLLRDNGAVEYPWHGWQGGTDNLPDEAYDLVVAFEISPEYTRVI